MTEEDWDIIYRSHTKATFSCTKAVWDIMMKKGYGRIITTSSSAGMFGSFGQVNYSNAKMGFFGFTQSLAKEGERKNIKVNCIAPLAGSRMTKAIMPEEIYKLLDPNMVAPLVALLSHEECPDTGVLYEVAGGYVARVRW
jgi:NAD(P)-dependent dehydrogenase (short-subunit alcohol dehydrogenase family)